MAIAIWKCGAACAISLACISTAQAERANFYTIIGPNGQMIVIDRNAASEQATPASEAQPAKRRWSLFSKKPFGKQSAGATVDAVPPPVALPVQNAQNIVVTPSAQVQPNPVNLPSAASQLSLQSSSSGSSATPATVAPKSA
ncbi:MAG: hypothetical protein EOO68_07580, partial [Moraxellaceae bacterium]